MGYTYPLQADWTTEEIVHVVRFFEEVEKAYEGGNTAQAVLSAYRQFKEVVPSMAEEKTLFKQFATVSQYESYLVVREAKKGTEIIQM